MTQEQSLQTENGTLLRGIEQIRKTNESLTQENRELLKMIEHLKNQPEMFEQQNKCLQRRINELLKVENTRLEATLRRIQDSSQVCVQSRGHSPASKPIKKLCPNKRQIHIYGNNNDNLSSQADQMDFVFFRSNFLESSNY